MHWIKKWLAPFFLVSTSSIAMQSLGKIVLRMSAVRAKMWCLFFFLSRSESGGFCIPGVHSLNKYCVMVYGSMFGIE